MRAAARRLMDQFAPEMPGPAAAPQPIAGDPDKINALEAPDGLGPEPLPATWTPEHVGKRIEEAFGTMAKLPPLRGPKVPGNSWMPYLYDRADLNAQESLDSADEKAARRRARNRVLTRPTSIELQRMEIVLNWMSELHAVDDGLCRIVQRWAKLRTTGGNVKSWCRATGLSFQLFYRRRDKAFAIIAARLVERATPVW